MVKRERMNVESSKILEEDDALPLLMSMAQIQTKAALDASRLPTISSILPSLPATFGSSTSTHFSQMAPSTPPIDRTSSSSPVPQSSPPSPSTLSPGLFGSYSLISTSSASSTSFGHATSSATPVPSATSSHHHQQQAYVSATNSLMELSDIISSSTQKLPVPISPAATSVKPERSDDSESDNGADVDNGEYVDSDGLATTGSDSPVSSRTRRVTRSQQKQIDRLRSEIELERERARELEQTLQFALRERSELLAGKQKQQQQLSGPSFVNVLSAASADGSPQVVFVDLPRTPHSAPPAATSSESSAEAEPRPLSVGRSRSAPMLPPIASIPALSPYLSRKRGSLPSPFGAAASPLPGSPSTSPLRAPAGAESAYVGARGASSRRRKSVDRDDTDEDYDPASSAATKKIKRTRSMSEAAGRRLPGVGSTRRRRSESQYQAGSRSAYGGDDDHDHGHVAAAFMAMRAKAIEERYARESRLMDVVEGADQEDDNDDGDDYAEYRQQQEQKHQQQQPSRVATRRDSVLDFIKDHPHASFWLKARN